MLKYPILPALWVAAFGLIGPIGCGQRAESGDSTPAAEESGQVASISPAEEASPDHSGGLADTIAGNSPQALLAAAVRALDGHRYISAEIRHTEKLFGRSYGGLGVYHEQRQGGSRLMRLELKIPLGDQASSLVHVCDGQYLWKHRNLFGDSKLSRIDLAKASRAMEKTDRVQPPDGVGLMPELGGLSGLLSGLEKAFEFTSAQPGQWGGEKRPVWKLSGRWKTDYLIRAMPAEKEALERGKPVDPDRLPEHLPDRVVVLLGQDDLFPYRIEYRRTRDGKESELVWMELFRVRINVPIEPSQFRYNPGERADDETAEFVKSLKAKK